jgi:hypothetical protein
MDLLDSRYFQDALFEQLEQTFKYVVHEQLIDDIYKAENNAVTLKVAGINTHLYRMLTLQLNDEGA